MPRMTFKLLGRLDTMLTEELARGVTEVEVYKLLLWYAVHNEEIRGELRKEVRDADVS